MRFGYRNVYTGARVARVRVDHYLSLVDVAEIIVAYRESSLFDKRPLTKGYVDEIVRHALATSLHLTSDEWRRERAPAIEDMVLRLGDLFEIPARDIPAVDDGDVLYKEPA